MNKRLSTPLLAVLIAAVLLLAAPISLEAARSAVRLWLESFLPSMLPFFLLMPFLTGPEARDGFSRVFGKLLPRLFGIPGRAAGALLTGLVAGSPAGAIACGALSEELSPGEYERLVYLCSGVSPPFLVAAVGVGCFGSAQTGAILLGAHLLALTAGGLLLRRAHGSKAAPPPQAATRLPSDPILAAMLRLLGVLGWMILFSVLSALLRLCLRPLAPDWIVAGLCEVSGGAAAVAAAPLPAPLRLAAAAGVCCFGGLCVGAQVLSATGVSPLRLLGAKLLHAALGTAAALAFERLRVTEISFPEALLPADPLAFSAAVAAAAVLAVAICLLARDPGVDEPPRGPYTDRQERLYKGAGRHADGPAAISHSADAFGAR